MLAWLFLKVMKALVFIQAVLSRKRQYSSIAHMSGTTGSLFQVRVMFKDAHLVWQSN
jgi:hypothetical protein